MRRLTVFAKGNLDVHDSLHSFTVGGKLAWNGINEIVRQRFPETVVRVRHEPLSRFDALLGADGNVPAEIARRDLALGPFAAKSQFSLATFDGSFDAIVFSIQADITVALMRHKRDGFLFHAHNSSAWPSDDRAWLRQAFMSLDLIDVNDSMAALSQVVTKIRRRSQAPILVYNVCAVSPGDTIHCYQGLEEEFSTRVRRFNLALIELSREIGISIIDVDTIIARAGADRVKSDPIHLTPEGHRLVTEEVVRVLDDYGCFAATAEVG